MAGHTVDHARKSDPSRNPKIHPQDLQVAAGWFQVAAGWFRPTLPDPRECQALEEASVHSRERARGPRCRFGRRRHPRRAVAGESSRASGHRGRAIGASTSSLRPVRSVPSVRRTHGVQTEPRFPSVSFSIQPDRKAMNMPTCERRTAGPDPTLPHVAFHTGLSLGRTSFVDCSTLNRRSADGGLDG